MSGVEIVRLERSSVECGLRGRQGRPVAISAVALALAAAIVSAFAPAARAQDPAQPVPARSVPSIEQRVDAFVEQLEARRKAQGVVGAAVVVVQGDRIVRAAGLGQRSAEAPEPVTDETVFAVGSVTKQFTAMAVALTVSEGKMAFEDHPRRHVPPFRLQDPEADAKLNMIDLLAHRSGLDRSDVTWLLAPFTQEELFELAHRSKPAAQLRARFLYNNTMYALAGAAAARAQQTTYERLLTERLLEPIGMPSSTLTLAALIASPNRAIGYRRSTAGQPERANPVDLASVAPAGALNSTARDMGAWLRFLNSRGRINGEAKITPAALARLFEPHQQVSHIIQYGLGFFLQTRSGVLVAEHGGNVPGYTAQVVHVPDRALSLALLTNQDSSQLAAIAQELFWEVVVSPEVATAPSVTPSPPAGTEPRAGGETATLARPIAPERLPGHYFSSQGGGAFEVKKGDSGTIAVFSGQPPYPLKPTAVNAFDLSGLSGFSLTFSESSVMPGRITAFLRQPRSHPGGNIAFLKKDDAWLARAKAQHDRPDKELIGSYRNDAQTTIMEIVPYQRGVALIITGQPPWLLNPLGGDLYQLEGLPETYRLRAKRSSDGAVFGFTLNQPNLSLEMSAATPAAAGDAEKAHGILDKAVAAAGGAEALDRITSMSALARASAPTHGLDGRAEDHISSGNRAELFELGAFGKTVFKSRVLTSERRSLTILRDGERFPASGKALLAARFFAVPHQLQRWKERFVTVLATGEASVNGEHAFVIELTPKDLAPMQLYISSKSFLILREEMPTYEGDELQSTSVSTDYSDYRVVSGVWLPFAASVPAPILGRIMVTYDSVSLNNPIDPKVFEEPRP
jgi:CubicO group peptidase (beta-lactamase class C family)